MLYCRTQDIKLEGMILAAHQVKGFPLSPYRMECSFTIPSSHLFLQIICQH